MFSIKLAWKEFNVDVSAMEAFVKALDPSCTGTSADSMLTFHMTSNPNEIPMHEVVTEQEVTESTPVLDEDGNPAVSEDGEPIMEATTRTVEVRTMEPTGEPSIAQCIQQKWDSITEESPEAVAYATNARKRAIKKQVEAINEFSANLLAQFNSENIDMGITQDGMTEDVLDVMLPVMSALQGGAPTVAIKRAKAIPESSYDSKFVTEARLLSYVNQIEKFLGLPTSQSL